MEEREIPGLELPRRGDRDPEAYPPELMTWEAACMKNMAALLDSMEAARSEWQSLSRRLTAAEAQLESAMKERDGFGALRVELEALRSERDALVASSRELERVSGELLETRRRLDAVERERAGMAETRRRLAELEAEVGGLRGQLARAQAEAAAAKPALAETEALRRDLAAAREQLESATRERDALLAAGSQREEVAIALDRAQAQVKALQRESSENLLAICDLRYTVNRLEKEKSETAETASAKVKKILGKVHEALDSAGAPKGEELSFGDRIRALRERIEELERRP